MQETQSQAQYTDHCLECRIGPRRIALPLTFVDQIIQYDCTPLALAVKHVGGLGIHDGRIIISVSLSQVSPRASTNTKGVLLRGLPGDSRWALEVDETFSFVDVIRHEGASRSVGHRWLAPANSLDGRQFEWLDLEHLISVMTSGSGP